MRKETGAAVKKPALTAALILALAMILGAACAEPLRMEADLTNTVTVPLNEQASYIFSYAYPQADPADPAGELINAFYAYIARDSEEFGVPMTADYYRGQNPEKDITAEVSYEITCNNDDYFSLLIRTRQEEIETWAGHTFSRKDLKAGSTVALPYLLGILATDENDEWLLDRQTEKANALIREMVWTRLTEAAGPGMRPELTEEDLEYEFFPEEDFYLDETGNPVFFLQPGFAGDGGEAMTFSISLEEILDEM